MASLSVPVAFEPESSVHCLAAFTAHSNSLLLADFDECYCLAGESAVNSVEIGASGEVV